MSKTVNGHQVLTESRTTGSLPRLRKWLIPGTNRHLYLRDGAMGFLLVHFALWFHEKVERLDLGTWDEWGWAVRPVRGQITGYSNHAGAVAADLNATRHPRGVPATQTFTHKQIRAIKARVRWMGGRLIWGGEWHTPDGMHVECAPGEMKWFERLAKVLCRSPRGKRILAANPGAKAVIYS